MVPVDTSPVPVDAVCWRIDDERGWAAVTSIPGTRGEADAWQPERVRINNIVYTVTETAVTGRAGHGWEILVFTWSPLDEVPEQSAYWSASE